MLELQDVPLIEETVSTSTHLAQKVSVILEGLLRLGKFQGKIENLCFERAVQEIRLKI